MARDPLRRRASRDLQNSRRKLERAAARLRKQANAIEKARRDQWRREHPGERRTFEASPLAKKLRNQARTYEKFAARSTSRGKTLAEIGQRILDLESRVYDSANSAAKNAQFRFELGMAQRGERTNMFGEGEQAKTNIRLFWMKTKQAWQGSLDYEGRYDAILAAYKAENLYEVYDEISSRDDFAEFVAKWLNIDFSMVDTTDEDWQSMIYERFEELKSSEQVQIVNSYNGK